MAILGFPHPRRRSEYVGGLYTTRTHKGKQIASVWPVWKRTRTHAQKVNEHGFRSAMHTVAGGILGPLDFSANLARRIGMRAQDFRYAVAMGTMFTFVGTDGRLYTGLAVRNLLTQWYDTVAPGLGTLLVRYQMGWASPSPGMPGDRLIATAEGPAWAGGQAMADAMQDTVAAQQISKSLDGLGGLPGALAYRAKDRWTTLDIGTPGQYLAVSSELMPEWQSEKAPTNGVEVIGSNATLGGSTQTIQVTLTNGDDGRSVIAVLKNSGGDTAALTDSRGGTWTTLERATGGESVSQIYQRTAGAALVAGDMVTATNSGTENVWGFAVATVTYGTQPGANVDKIVETNNTLNGIALSSPGNTSSGTWLCVMMRGNYSSGSSWIAGGDFEFLTLDSNLSKLLAFGVKHDISALPVAAAASTNGYATNMTAIRMDLV